MTQKDNSLALLPNGFADLLPPFAEGEARAIQILMDKFTSFGYLRIKPPLLEFEDSLLAAGLGEHLAHDTFRLMDPVSSRMLGVRSDCTAQVSRIVSSRLENEPRPLRLTYANDVLRTKGSQMRTERQFTQVGCELIGSVDVCESDIEICVLAILGLKSLGVKDITLDLTIPRFISHLTNDGDILKAVKSRDMNALLAVGGDSSEIIAQAMDASGAADTAIAAIDKINLDKELRASFDNLKDVCAGVEKAMAELEINDVSLSIDLIEQVGFEYHNTIGFTLFAQGLSGELGRGGRYDVHFGQNEINEMARGFTIYMDMVARLSTPPLEKDRVFVRSKEPWSLVLDLQDKGWVVVRGVGDGAQPKNCSHIYEDGKIKEFKSEELL